MWENVSIKCLGTTGVSHNSSMPGDSVNGQFQQSFPTNGKAGRGFHFFRVKYVIKQPRISEILAKRVNNL